MTLSKIAHDIHRSTAAGTLGSRGLEYNCHSIIRSTAATINLPNYALCSQANSGKARQGEGKGRALLRDGGRGNCVCKYENLLNGELQQAARRISEYRTNHSDEDIHPKVSSTSFQQPKWGIHGNGTKFHSFRRGQLRRQVASQHRTNF